MTSRSVHRVLAPDDQAALLDERTIDDWLDARLAADRAAGAPSIATQLALPDTM